MNKMQRTLCSADFNIFVTALCISLPDGVGRAVTRSSLD